MNDIFCLSALTVADFLDRTAEAGLYGVLGMGVIFLVLGVIWAILAVFNRIFVNQKDVDKIFESDEETKPVDVDDDGETIAAITAVISSILAEEAKTEAREPVKFKVVSFRRVNKKSGRN